MWLEHRLARAVGDAEIVFCVATVEGGRGAQPTGYQATIFTPEFVVSGEIRLSDFDHRQYQPAGDVRIVPRSKIQSLTLHHVDSFASDDEGPDYVSFTATFEGIEPVFVDMPRHAAQDDGSTSRIFDALREDLAGTVLR